jgi:microcystin degradation protein MlrC
MRFAILGISHETNTFSKVPADYHQFEMADLLRGDEIIEQFQNSLYTTAGYLQAAKDFGFEAVPLMWAQTGPIGTITKDAYDRISGEMLGMLRDQGPWDAVLLPNHGAAVSEEYPDMDGEFTRAVREIVGPDVPVGITLDMHANVSKAVVANTDICVVWRTNPHLDPRPRGYKCAELIYRTVKGEIKPTQWIEMPPLVVNIVRQFTGEEPMKSIVADSIEALKRPGILDTSVAEGYPYSDVDEMGMSWVAITDNNPALAKETAIWMAERAWKHREALNTPVASIREALENAVKRYRGPRRLGDWNEVPTDGTALTAPSSEVTADGTAPNTGPIILMDVGDNIGGGSSADSTVILAEAQKMGVRSLLQSLYDPESVKACVKAGVGAEVTLDVGAKTDDMHGKPVRVTGKVRSIIDGDWEDFGATHGGYRFYDAGTAVRLDTTDGHTLFLTSKRAGNTSRYGMYAAGIIPEHFQIVVAKGVVSPRPAYQPIAGEVVLVNTPGVTTADLSYFTFHRRRKPLYPFEPDVTYKPGI